MVKSEKKYIFYYNHIGYAIGMLVALFILIIDFVVGVSLMHEGHYLFFYNYLVVAFFLIYYLIYIFQRLSQNKFAFFINIEVFFLNINKYYGKIWGIFG